MRKPSYFLPILILFFLSFGAGKASSNDSDFGKPIHTSLMISEPRNQPQADEDISSSADEGDAASRNINPVVGYGNWTAVTYQSYASVNWDIYLTYMSGGTNQITSDSSTERYPRLNTSATEIVYDSNILGNFDVYKIEIASGISTKLTTSDQDDVAAVWSPDNSRIAYSSDVNANEKDKDWEIFIMNADGTGKTRLTNNNRKDLFPTFSPDGSQIAWIRYTNGTNGKIWVMNSDGSSPRAITNEYDYIQIPVWSPDGTKIAFDADFTGDGWNDLIIIDADGQNARLLLPGANLRDHWMGTWSPDGKTILYTQVYYISISNTLYIDTININRIKTDGSTSPSWFTDTDLAMMPDWKLFDVYPPSSEADPLPTYSRADGFLYSWTTDNPGVSDIVETIVQYRINGGDWQSINHGLYLPDNELLTGNPGEFVELRVKSTDEAGNEGAWSSTISSTTLFSNLIKGAVYDNQGIPIEDPTLVITNSFPLIQSTGIFTGYVQDLNTHQFSVSNYGLDGRFEDSIQTDKEYNFYLTPSDNVLINGDFEQTVHRQDVPGWQVQGVLSRTIGTGFLSSGGFILGESCLPPCFGNQILIDDTSSYYSVLDMAVDSNNVIHSVWSTLLSDGQGQGIYYRYKVPGQSWSSFTKIFAGAGNVNVGIDSNDTLHVTFGYQTNDLYYLNKTAQGLWSTPELIQNLLRADMTIDSEDRLHLTGYASASDRVTAAYIYRDPNGLWSSRFEFPEKLYDTRSGPAIGVDSTGKIYLLAKSQFSNDLYLYSKEDGEAWSNKNLLISSFGAAYSLGMVIDNQDNVHMMYQQGRGSYYFYQTQRGDIDAPLWLVGVDENSMAIGADNQLHIIFQDGSRGVFYLTKYPSGNWSNRISLYDNISTRARGILVDQGNIVHALYGSFNKSYYITKKTAVLAGSVSISQTVEITNTLQVPTISFLYKIENGELDSPALTIKILDETRQTNVVFTATVTNGWSHGSVDLSQWAGQSITVEFSLSQKENFPASSLYLDNIAIGSLSLAPKITNISVNYTENFVRSILVTGLNLHPDAGFYLGNYQATTVNWLNSNQAVLNFTNLPPGVYQLQVINPNERSHNYGQYIKNGYIVFLPNVIR